MPLEQLLRDIHNCPHAVRGKCPVADKFKKQSSKKVDPVPEAYRARNPKAKLIIIGINPGIGTDDKGNCANEYSNDFEKYKAELKQPLDRRFWQYYKAANLLRYDFINEVMVTNLIHCPTRNWTNKKDKEWWLEADEKCESIKLCNHFCFELVDEVKPDSILLHGLDVIEFFRKRLDWQDIPQNPKSIDIQGKREKWEGRTVIMSRHLQSIRDNVSWNKLANRSR